MISAEGLAVPWREVQDGRSAGLEHALAACFGVPGSRTACRAEVHVLARETVWFPRDQVQESEDLEEEDEAPDVDLDKDPNWLKVKQAETYVRHVALARLGFLLLKSSELLVSWKEMARIWDMRYEARV